MKEFAFKSQKTMFEQQIDSRFIADLNSCENAGWDVSYRAKHVADNLVFNTSFYIDPY